MSDKLTNSEIVEFFLADAAEHLQTINDDLLRLEHDQADLDLVDKIFRAVHAIKGSAGMSGFFVVSQLSHKIEDLLGKLRDRELEVCDDIIDLLFQGADTLSHQVDNISNGQPEDETVLTLMDELSAEFLGTPETVTTSGVAQPQLSAHAPTHTTPSKPKLSPLEMAAQYIRRDQFDEALALYQKILQRSPANGNIRQLVEETKALQAYLQEYPA